jgi:hypothetical protein
MLRSGEAARREGGLPAIVVAAARAAAVAAEAELDAIGGAADVWPNGAAPGTTAAGSVDAPGTGESVAAVA